MIIFNIEYKFKRERGQKKSEIDDSKRHMSKMSAPRKPISIPFLFAALSLIFISIFLLGESKLDVLSVISGNKLSKYLKHDMDVTIHRSYKC